MTKGYELVQNQETGASEYDLKWYKAAWKTKNGLREQKISSSIFCYKKSVEINHYLNYKLLKSIK